VKEYSYNRYHYKRQGIQYIVRLLNDRLRRRNALETPNQ